MYFMMLLTAIDFIFYDAINSNRFYIIDVDIFHRYSVKLDTV
jgi:hypothetical protein